MATKVCSVCKVGKSPTSFSPHKDKKDGLQYACRECRNFIRRDKRANNPEWRMANVATTNKWREANPIDKDKIRFYNIFNTYGLTKDGYNEILKRQCGKCAICDTTVGNASKKHKHLYVDHCHDTGEIRGLLCGRCNLLIGAANENAQILASCINYLTFDRGF